MTWLLWQDYRADHFNRIHRSVVPVCFNSQFQNNKVINRLGFQKLYNVACLSVCMGQYVYKYLSIYICMYINAYI